MWKNEGFFLAELLLALLTWLIAASFLLPLAMFILGENERIAEEHEAVRLVYEEMLWMKSKGTERDNYRVSLNGVEYKLSVKPGPGISKEVCAQYVGQGKNKREICRPVE
ncbi:hypothetical protein [Bacillus massilinigeriensis]|uniref:hypothetical protein n=1 Tax=Bacillus mediterraneensis TaxID=1805474 RepID=UPI00114D45E8|nr:hypothetical protein [Bacillus mediterraneensis]